MNRIVIIGNGFDLAHGLKTSYKDFINWYWEDCGDRLLHCHNKTVADGLCSFELKDSINLHCWSHVWGYHYQRSNPLKPWNLNDVVSLAQKNKDLCDFSFTSPLLKRIWNQLLLGWVDIENEYFSLLTEEKLTIDKSLISQNYKELNSQLNILRDKLIQYLKRESENEIPVIDNINDIIYKPIKEREISVAYKRSLGGNTIDDIIPYATMFLNFNYTKTPEMYLSPSSKVLVNYIHGNLENPESVIFGYGDELDSGFKKLQNMNDNECLRHIKSIRYLESDSYRKMLEFIESDSFQIIIMGHSCGLSDRTLLSTLFEHENCVSIKPCYYINKDGIDNHLDIIQNISRNFTDMKLMRDRVVNKTFCEPFVNYKESQE